MSIEVALDKAVQIGGLLPQKNALALQNFTSGNDIENLIAAFGTVDFDQTYDYKDERLRHVKSFKELLIK